jgi:hypothetical protein
MLVECPEKTSISPWVVLSPDRATPAVLDVCKKYVLNPRVIYAPLPFPLVSQEDGQQWIKGRNWMLDQAEQAGVKARWVTAFDDDWQWGPGWDVHLPAMLETEEVDSWKAISLVLWDRADGGLDVNTLQIHASPLIGRHKVGWRHDLEKTDFLTRQCAALGNVCTMPFFIMDYGCIVAAERRAMFKRYVKAGKLCGYVKNYIRDPIRRPLQECLGMHPEEYYAFQVQQWGRIGYAKQTQCSEPGGSGGT